MANGLYEETLNHMREEKEALLGQLRERPRALSHVCLCA